ncbi:MAG: hypothetical protein IPL06_17050 [Betaproteobacteria bacterium]|nr:hypothetical protein [Betaproteobacteria bacterium]
MSPNRIILAAAAFAASLSAADALAFNCYVVIDKDQNVVFRATRPPFGMDGDDWRKGQDDLRAKNQHLRWTFTPDCFPQITEVRKAYATTRTAEAVFDPSVVLGNTQEYMTATGRPTSSSGGYSR